MGKQENLTLLKDGVIPERYQRNIGTIGIAGQIRLLEAKVAVVGAGGLGGMIVELLARQGVGYLKIIDGDCFSVGNLNRQLLATEENIGNNKAVAAARRIGIINSDVEAEAVPVMLDESNAHTLLEGMDVAVDALDTLDARRLLGFAARQLKMPLVHGAIAGFAGLVTTLMPDGPGVEKLYGAMRGNRGIETMLGNPAATPALTAAVQAQEVVKLVTGTGQPLVNRLLHFDTEVNTFKIITYNG